MNKYIYLIVLFFWSCPQTSNSQNEAKVIISENGLSIKEDTLKSNPKAKGHCDFDQATLTDEFLKEIKEFEGYSWDQESKIATIVLSKKETLKIFRGGCDFYMVSALFKIDDLSLNYPKDKDYILSKVKWIANLIEDFQDIKISELIDANIFTEIKGENNTTLELLRFEDLMKIWIWVNNEGKYSEVALSYRIN